MTAHAMMTAAIDEPDGGATEDASPACDSAVGPATAEVPVVVSNVTKTFVMHLRGGIELPVLRDVSFAVQAGTCAVLGGPSGVGKSSILKMVFGNYRADGGSISVFDRALGPVDVITAPPRAVMRLRAATLGYVSQFLRVIPRVNARDTVAGHVRDARGVKAAPADARARAEALLARLNVPERLWDLPPATFSGGEQQRVNIACGLAGSHSVLLLDEPTASLDGDNRKVVVELLQEKKAQGAALVGIFHDHEVREAIADTTIDVTRFSPR